jgi:hypothetical protein
LETISPLSSPFRLKIFSSTISVYHNTAKNLRPRKKFFETK